MMKLIQIHPRDNVAVALETLPAGTALSVGGCEVTAAQEITRGHKIALAEIPAGGEVVKYGNVIGIAKEDIKPGSWVHTHNVKTGLSEGGEYVYDHQVFELPQVPDRTFQGFRRKDGRAAIRNAVWIIPTVGCVNSIAQIYLRGIMEPREYPGGLLLFDGSAPVDELLAGHIISRTLQP